MRIQRLRLKNGYKRFHDLTIDLGPTPARIVVLVGPNGCGKSSVLDGIMYHQQLYQAVGSVHVNDASYHSMDSARNIEHNDIEITFAGGGNFSDARNSRQQSGKPNTVFSFRSPYRYNTYVKIHEVRAMPPIKENSYGAGYAGALDSKMEENYRRLQGMVNRYTQDNDVKPSEARSKIIGELNQSIKRCLDLEIVDVGDVESGSGTLYFSKYDQKNKFEFNVLSAGEKEVIDILLDLFLRKSDFNDSVFLIDEPELHINTSIQGRLLNEIDALVGDDCQIWLTTHSIGFLRRLQSEMRNKCQIIQFDPALKLASEPQNLKPMKGSAAAWRELFKVALDDLSELVSPKTIIYCEGRDAPSKSGEERGMDAKAFNTIFADTHPDVLFISSGGNTELDQRSQIAIAILGKVFQNVEILVFKDRDMISGRIADESDRQTYLKHNAANHRVMKRFELENYLYDKDVLKAYCNAQDLIFDESQYDAFVVDITNQNLKDETGRIKKICGISTSINGEVFKLNLASHLTEGMSAFAELADCVFSRK
ncbi:AAA family ATPase [Novosphingobium mangrovi (ex Huang et al. 2023)]|uniref:AAA family ATPase n=1 Tax=Novosphingobium mangrovi (ex Huang et al. 2023) TaxID=2976432 RepID=A0ABT2I6I4_9SPHN|nr:AAA family ATPase [Novosphingobium mangrovi (ex Huang et al. 2023)]MCT2400428.1 AAA family ATPase [Novosphingobium mangrovi (ex Huang et al. 2023)]